MSLARPAIPPIQQHFAHNNLRAKINEFIRQTTVEYLGAPYVSKVGSKKDKTEIDCSGLVARIAEKIEGLDQVVTVARSSQGQFTALQDAFVPYDIYEKISDIPLLDEGMIIFLNEGPTAWQQQLIKDGHEVERKDGINHVVMIFRDEAGTLMISESSRKIGCVHIEPVTNWLERKAQDPKIEKIFIIDMVEAVPILKANANLQTEITQDLTFA